MEEIKIPDDGVLPIDKLVCNSSTVVPFEGEEHEFHNPQLHKPGTLQVVLYGYILPILVFLRYD